jgi:hypothetical protein
LSYVTIISHPPTYHVCHRNCVVPFSIKLVHVYQGTWTTNVYINWWTCPCILTCKVFTYYGWRLNYFISWALVGTFIHNKMSPNSTTTSLNHRNATMSTNGHRRILLWPQIFSSQGLHFETCPTHHQNENIPLTYSISHGVAIPCCLMLCYATIHESYMIWYGALYYMTMKIILIIVGHTIFLVTYLLMLMGQMILRMRIIVGQINQNTRIVITMTRSFNIK